MQQVNEFLARPLFAVNGFQVTAGIVVLVVVGFVVVMKLRGK